MRFRSSWVVLASILAVACDPAVPGGGEAEMLPAQRVAAFFAEDLAQCTTDSECPTGRCDLTPTFTVSIEKGYCGTFQTAFDPWQKVELALRLASAAKASPEMLEAALARIDEELGYTRSPPVPGYAVHPPEKETIVILLTALAGPQGGGTQGARSRLETLHKMETGVVRRLAGLALAELGNEAGRDDMVEASFGSSPRLRLHACRGAAGLCDETAIGVLASLLEDPHPLVRFGAAQGLGGCATPEARKVLEARRDALRKKPGQPGDLSAAEAALARGGD